MAQSGQGTAIQILFETLADHFRNGDFMAAYRLILRVAGGKDGPFTLGLAKIIPEDTHTSEIAVVAFFL